MHTEEGEEGATHHANVSVKGALDVISQAQRNCANMIAPFYNEGSAFAFAFAFAITRQYSHISFFILF